MSMSNHEIAAELLDIKDQIDGLLHDAEVLLRNGGDRMVYERARSYWLAHIKCALSNDHGYLSRGMCTMTDSINELEREDEEEEE